MSAEVILQLRLLVAFSITGISILSLAPVAPRIGLVDLPGGRKTHLQVTPQVGGIGIYLGMLVSSFMLPEAFASPVILLSLAGLVLVVGAFDDARELTVGVRMFWHVTAALLMALLGGVQLQSLGDLVFTGPVLLGILAVPMTVFATVGVINAVNMSDGVDGLSGSLVSVSLGFLAVVYTLSGDRSAAAFLALTICAIMAFLGLNFRSLWGRPALVYLGDAGSTMLGFIVAWLFIDATQGDSAVFAPVYALWFLAVPLFDTVYQLISRPLRGKSSFDPGRDHFHHALARLGFSDAAIVLFMAAIAVVLGGVGLVGHLVQVNESVMFIAFLVLFAAYYWLSATILHRDTTD